MDSVRCPLHDAARTSMNKPAVTAPEGQLFFSDVEQCVAGTCTLLKRGGLKRGQRIGIVCSQSWQQPILWMAVLRAGAVICPIRPELWESRSRELMERFNPQHILVERELNKRLQNPVPEPLFIEDFVGVTGLFKRHERIELQLRNPALIEAVDVGLPTERFLLYSIRNLYYGAYGMNRILAPRSEECWMTTEMWGTAASIDFIWRCWMGGGSVALPDPRQDFFEAVSAYNVTSAILGRSHVDAILQTEHKAETCSLRLLLVNALTTSETMMNQLYQLGYRVFCYYRIPEMAGYVALSGRAGVPAVQYPFGKVLRYRQMELSSSGQICVRGEVLSGGDVSGNEVKAVTDTDGWFCAPYTGVVDKDGCLQMEKIQPIAG